MKIKVLSTIRHDDQYFQPGEIMTVDKEVAERLLANGAAAPLTVEVGTESEEEEAAEPEPDAPKAKKKGK